MALTQYTADTDIIETLGTNPEDRPTLTDNSFKAKFDENAANIAAFLNAMITELASVSAAKGASCIGLQDSAGRFTATQVEAALAEIAGSGRTTETVKGLADLISTNDGKLTTHKAEIAAHAELTNRTITVGVGKAFTTIQAAIDSIKKRVDAAITITVDAGTYAEKVVIAGFVGSGSIALNGDTVVGTSYNVTTSMVSNCTCGVTVRGFRATATSGIAFKSTGCIKCVFSYCNTTAACAEGFTFSASYGTVANSTTSNKTTAGILADTCSIVFSNTNSGTSNAVGLYCYLASKIGKSSTQPAGTTAEFAGTGGQIV